jgi:hypothetical protein
LEYAPSSLKSFDNNSEFKNKFLISIDYIEKEINNYSSKETFEKFGLK